MRVRAGAVGLSALLAVLGACASGPEPPRGVGLGESPARGTVAAPAAFVTYFRNDAAVSARAEAPMLAESTWASYAPPRERPVLFSRWRQR